MLLYVLLADGLQVTSLERRRYDGVTTNLSGAHLLLRHFAQVTTI